MSTAEPDLEVALRRVMVGYRVVGAVWLWLLVAVVVLTETGFNLPLVMGAGVLAAAWTGATVWSSGVPGILRTPWWIAADVAVSAAVIAFAAFAGTDRGFYGGYPFSTVLLAAYSGGIPGGFVAAGVLSVVSVVFLGVYLGNPGEVITSALVYVAGAGVSVWGIGVIRRNDAQRRALEQRLASEEVERARSQERADTAVALHDSVLQTLALIQRRSDDPAAVRSVARQQERELRDWLSGSRSRLGGGTAATLAAAIADVAAELETRYPCRVEVVTVGDVALGTGTDALVAATREALLNVAKHAAVQTAAVYAEVEDTNATVFVRDRGAGFEPGAVPPDRRGISESIVGRVRRHGGDAVIRSTPGAGTEVELRIPLARS
ncbi:MAG: ATP-binding protein [Nitriliruptorales bacterium]|nr:ATP-binding protein [Nitriliruptorales bacterium]